ncbi:MAG TPA: hypothetical protein V6D05_08560 [Stenomitos sp.]
MLKTVATLAFLGAFALPAAASTMPRADITGRDMRYFGLGLGHALSVSADVALAPQWTLGASLGTGYWNDPEPYRYDVRWVYSFVTGGRTGLSIAGILGIWGGTTFQNPYNLDHLPVPEVGFGLAYPFTRDLVARLNLIVPYYGQVPGPYFYMFGGPSGGLELGYRVRPYMEATLGINGQGNYLGMKLDF